MLQMAGCHRLCAHIVLMRAPIVTGSQAKAKPQPLRLTVGVSSHLLQVFHRKLCVRKRSLCGQ
jgi:hypothetical protein